jgi:dihydroneopterin aldolase
MVTRLIVEVGSEEEAQIALTAGADGVEGLSPGQLRPIVELVAGRCPVGATLPAGAPDDLPEIARQAIASGADYVVHSFGRGEDASAACRRLAAEVPPGMSHAAIRADEPALASVLAALAAAGFAAARLETREGRLLERLPIATLQQFIRACAAEGLASGLSGRLEAPDVPRLLELEPDSLVSALGRRPGLEAGGIARLRALLPGKQPVRAGEPGAAVATDRVFLHDLVLPVFVGAYGHEEQSRQRVRFAVEVDVARVAVTAHDMGDIFSYDLILDGIRLLTASGHWVVIESLAERIAARLLRHPRAMRVTVRIEKLDVSPCVVGVEIVRTRAGAPRLG